MSFNSEDNYLKELKSLFEATERSSSDERGKKTWILAMRDKLFSIFQSPMEESYRKEAFKWAAELSNSFDGFDWISPHDKWNPNEARMFTCLSISVIGEIHLLLPLVIRHLSHGPEDELEDNKVMERSANSDDYDQFGSLLIILEYILKALVKSDSNHDELENNLVKSLSMKDMQTLLAKLKNIFTSLCEYLELVHRYWSSLVKIKEDERFSAAQGALRIAATWLAEDPTMFETQCERFLLHLMIRAINADAYNSDILMVAIHSICTENQTMIDALKKCDDYYGALDKYLSHVKLQANKNSTHRDKKLFKLRCGLIKDLMIACKNQSNIA